MAVTSTDWGMWVYGFVVLCSGAPKGSTGSGSGFKASQKMGHCLNMFLKRLSFGSKECIEELKQECANVLGQTS